MKRSVACLLLGLSLGLITGLFGSQGLAAERSADITQVVLTVSRGPVEFTDELRQQPPMIILEFHSRNVQVQLEPRVSVEAGIIKSVESEYYPSGWFGRRALKRLTLHLAQPAPYTVTQQANRLLIAIETPSALLPGQVVVGRGMRIQGVEAKETVFQRLSAMESALRQAEPSSAVGRTESSPIVVTKAMEIPRPIIQPAPPSRGGFWTLWLGVVLGIGGTLIASRRRRRRTAARLAEKPSTAPASPMIAQAASVFEQLVLRAIQRQGQQVVSAKAIAGLGTLWIVEQDGKRQGLACLRDGGYLEQKVLEQFHKTLQEEGLRSGIVYALGAFTMPAQTFAKENQINLISREEAWKLMEVELTGPGLLPDFAQAQATIQSLEQELANHKKQWGESEWYLGEERTKTQTLEQRVAELTHELTEKVKLSAKLFQEADQLKAKNAEADERLVAAQESRAQLEEHSAQLEEQFKIGRATANKHFAAEQEKRAQLEAQVAQLQEQLQTTGRQREEVLVEKSHGKDAWPGTERRKWKRLDLSRLDGKGILARVFSEEGEPINGDVRNIGAGGLCVEFPTAERLADEVELKLFFPERTKPIETIGKVIWKSRGGRRRMGQLGISFSAINAPDQEAISQFVEERQ